MGRVLRAVGACAVAVGGACFGWTPARELGRLFALVIVSLPAGVPGP